MGPFDYGRAGLVHERDELQKQVADLRARLERAEKALRWGMSEIQRQYPGDDLAECDPGVNYEVGMWQRFRAALEKQNG